MDEYKEQTYAHRYMAIRDGIVENVNGIAEAYEEENGHERVEDNHGEIRTYKISEGKLHKEAIEYACEKILERAEDDFNYRIYNIIELIMMDEFGREMSPSNPFRVPRMKVSMSNIGMPLVSIEGVK